MKHLARGPSLRGKYDTSAPRLLALLIRKQTNDSCFPPVGLLVVALVVSRIYSVVREMFPFAEKDGRR